MTRILVLEDSKDCLNAITAMLEKVSDRVCAVPVNSLKEARAALENEAQPFQAFLLDINLDMHDKEDISGILRARSPHETGVCVHADCDDYLAGKYGAHSVQRAALLSVSHQAVQRTGH